MEDINKDFHKIGEIINDIIEKNNDILLNKKNEINSYITSIEKTLHDFYSSQRDVSINDIIESLSIFLIDIESLRKKLSSFCEKHHQYLHDNGKIDDIYIDSISYGMINHLTSYTKKLEKIKNTQDIHKINLNDIEYLLENIRKIMSSTISDSNILSQRELIKSEYEIIENDFTILREKVKEFQK